MQLIVVMLVVMILILVSFNSMFNVILSNIPRERYNKILILRVNTIFWIYVKKMSKDLVLKFSKKSESFISNRFDGKIISILGIFNLSFYMTLFLVILIITNILTKGIPKPLYLTIMIFLVLIMQILFIGFLINKNNFFKNNLYLTPFMAFIVIIYSIFYIYMGDIYVFSYDGIKSLFSIGIFFIVNFVFDIITFLVTFRIIKFIIYNNKFWRYLLLDMFIGIILSIVCGYCIIFVVSFVNQDFSIDYIKNVELVLALAMISATSLIPTTIYLCSLVFIKLCNYIIKVISLFYNRKNYIDKKLGKIQASMLLIYVFIFLITFLKEVIQSLIK